MYTGGESKQVPCVGVSMGVERIFAIMEANQAGKSATPNVQCFVASVRWARLRPGFTLTFRNGMCTYETRRAAAVAMHVSFASS